MGRRSSWTQAVKRGVGWKKIPAMRRPEVRKQAQRRAAGRKGGGGERRQAKAVAVAEDLAGGGAAPGKYRVEAFVIEATRHARPPSASKSVGEDVKVVEARTPWCTSATAADATDTSCAVHLVAGPTGSPVLTQTARSETAGMLVNASVGRVSRASSVFTCTHFKSSILHRFFGCIRSVSGSASYGVQGHSVNARIHTSSDAQEARPSSSFLSTTFLRDFWALH